VVTQVRPAVAEDFIRNFLIKVGMTRTLDTFNTEWYEMRAKGHLGEQHAAKVPDIYFRNEELDEQVREATTLQATCCVPSLSEQPILDAALQLLHI
jgi:hypothetical protein